VLRRSSLTLPLVLALTVWAGRVRAQQPPEAAHEDVTPPTIQTRVEPAFPVGIELREAEVVVTVLVDAEGHVVEAKVTQSAGDALDGAAITAVKQWTFVAARRGAKAIASRVRVPVHFHATAPAPEFSTPAVDVNPTAGASAGPTVAAHAPAPHATPDDTETVNVWGRSHLPSRGGGDYDVPIGKLAAVPRSDAASLLRLAPGVMLTNLGGLGHPYQVFLRGFDAREGQDLEFTVDGIPMNDVGNPHGNGLADTHFIIPEVVRSLRVVEGPFAPQQGNFAVAGSALYDLGIEEPGLTTRASYGSFNTRRLLLLAHPEGCSDKTFAAGELLATDGFGRNRAAERASAIGGWEGHIGKASLRVLATSYATHYKMAGVLRADDVTAGRKGLGDTYDTEQGGDSARHSVQISIAEKLGNFRVTQSVFGFVRDFRLRQNLTGFTEDAQQTWQSVHPQRGDLADQQARSGTVGGRGAGRYAFTAFGKRRQEIEVGYYARYDSVDALQQRDRAGTQIPYRRDLDLWSGTTNLAAYVDANLHPLSWVTVRGGLRGDFFHYHLTNRCAVTAPPTVTSSAPDTECFSADRQGYRSPDQTGATGSSIAQPRGTLIFGPWDGVSLSGSVGLGARSIDPAYVNQDLAAPFATALAWESGASYERTHGAVGLLPDVGGPRPVLQRERRPRDARQRHLALGVAGLGARDRALLRRGGERHARAGELRRHGPARAVLAARDRARRRRAVRPDRARGRPAARRHRGRGALGGRAATAPARRDCAGVRGGRSRRQPQVARDRARRRVYQPLRHALPNRRVQLRLGLPHLAVPDARPRAHVRRGRAPRLPRDPRLHVRRRRPMSTSRKSALAVTLAATLGLAFACAGSAGGDRYEFEAFAGGAARTGPGPLTFTNDKGWETTLAQCSVTFGPVYLNTVAPLSGQQTWLGRWLLPWAHAEGASHLENGRVVGQVLQQISINALSPDLRSFGAGEMTQETVRTAEIGFYPPPGVAIDQTKIDQAAVDVIGSASKDGVTVRFRGRLVLDDAWLPDPKPGAPGAASVLALRLVRGIPAGFTPSRGGKLEIRVDPKVLFAGADFSSLVDDPTDSDGTKVLVQSKTGRYTTDQVMRNIFDGLRSVDAYDVRWRAQ
jgi:TonB family protein